MYLDQNLKQTWSTTSMRNFTTKGEENEKKLCIYIESSLSFQI